MVVETDVAVAADGFHQPTHGGVQTSSPGLEVSRGDFTWYVIMDLKITPSGQTIVKLTALGPVTNTDTKLLIYGLSKGPSFGTGRGTQLARFFDGMLVAGLLRTVFET